MRVPEISFGSPGIVTNRGVMIPGLELIPQSDFHHFTEIDDSDSNSSKNRFLFCTGIDSEYWNRVQIRMFIMTMIPILIPIPAKNGIITPLVTTSDSHCTELPKIVESEINVNPAYPIARNSI